MENGKKIPLSKRFQSPVENHRNRVKIDTLAQGTNTDQYRTVSEVMYMCAKVPIQDGKRGHVYGYSFER